MIPCHFPLPFHDILTPQNNENSVFVCYAMGVKIEHRSAGKRSRRKRNVPQVFSKQ